MDDATTPNNEGRVTVGLDLGDKYTQVCVLDSEGEVIEEARGRGQPHLLAGLVGMQLVRLAGRVQHNQPAGRDRLQAALGRPAQPQAGVGELGCLGRHNFDFTVGDAQFGRQVGADRGDDSTGVVCQWRPQRRHDCR